jgi:hypothetical protein
MSAVPPDRNTRFRLRHRVNLLLAERGFAVRVVDARNAAERETLGDYFLVDAHKRHIILQEHVNLYQLADEVGAFRLGEKPRASQRNSAPPDRWRTTGLRQHLSLPSPSH